MNHQVMQFQNWFHLVVGPIHVPWLLLTVFSCPLSFLGPSYSLLKPILIISDNDGYKLCRACYDATSQRHSTRTVAVINIKMGMKWENYSLWRFGVSSARYWTTGRNTIPIGLVFLKRSFQIISDHLRLSSIILDYLRLSQDIWEESELLKFTWTPWT
jgi:hypothetical protein